MNSKAWFESKTVVFNLLALLVAVATAFGFADFVPDTWVETAAIAIISTVNLFLRFQTSKPVG